MPFLIILLYLFSPLAFAQKPDFLPEVNDPYLKDIFLSSDTYWYDSTTIVPSYQDSMGDPKGNRPNTIDRNLIDLAVPGGHSRLFASRGRFNFPFGTGGADSSSNFDKVNFLFLPETDGKKWPVVYWRMPHARWRWLFPVGAVLGEVMLIKFADNSTSIFEIRTRTRKLDHWDNKVYRPFLSPMELSWAVKMERSDWYLNHKLLQLINTLETGVSVTKTLQSQHFRNIFTPVTGKIDNLPDFGDKTLVHDLLRNAYFRPVTAAWRVHEEGFKSYAPTTDGIAIVPTFYDGGLLPVDNTSCNRCHKDAGRQIGDFHGDLILYGEVWGEDQIFSWHPFDTRSFVDSQGNVVNFNNDNRKLRTDFQQMVVPLNRSLHPETVYKEIPRDWTYRPI